MITAKSGVIQFDVLTGKWMENIRTAETHIRKLADEGASLILLPELFSCSFDNPNLPDHCMKTPEILASLKDTARQNNIIIAASMPEKVDNKIYNTLFLIERNGNTAGRYRKIHLFTPTGEHNHFSSGTEPVVCETSIGRIGLMICYDLRFPELCRTLTNKGAEIILVSAQWPSPRVSHWDTLLAARAIENQVYIAAANRCGKTSELEFPGHSQIISPWGKVLAKADSSAGTLSATLVSDDLITARETIPCLNQRVYEAYE